SGTLSRILRAKAFQFLGMISYSFYLWHTLIMVGTKKIFRHLVGPLSEWGAIMVFFALSFGLTTIVAWGSYKVFEQFTSNWFA
ncbi:acyltransferase family protein, partial [Enterobacter bugandensis]|uniref:acyltransferase family protein n=1 Tax=Enterobacter bugandensis TaxID=881260 RepID=UPI003BEF0CC0